MTRVSADLRSLNTKVFLKGPCRFWRQSPGVSWLLRWLSYLNMCPGTKKRWHGNAEVSHFINSPKEFISSKFIVLDVTFGWSLRVSDDVAHQDVNLYCVCLTPRSNVVQIKLKVLLHWLDPGEDFNIISKH